MQGNAIPKGYSVLVCAGTGEMLKEIDLEGYGLERQAAGVGHGYS